MKLEEYSIEEIKKGYRLHKANYFECLECDKIFEIGEIFEIKGRFFDAERAVKHHIHQHGNRLEALIEGNEKYNTLTENQIQLLHLIDSGLSDKEIAKQQAISASTIRSQKFTFREKAKQAKLYLAIYEAIFESEKEKTDPLIEIHETATQVDERYHITESERTQIMATVFESTSPLKLSSFPKKQKKKIVILNEIIKKFKKESQYTEKEVNDILKGIFDDFVTLRRYLIEYGYLDRTADGKSYWVKTK